MNRADGKRAQAWGVREHLNRANHKWGRARGVREHLDRANRKRARARGIGGARIAPIAHGLRGCLFGPTQNNLCARCYNCGVPVVLKSLSKLPRFNVKMMMMVMMAMMVMTAMLMVLVMMVVLVVMETVVMVMTVMVLH